MTTNDVLSVWVCHALVKPSLHSGPCAHMTMTVSVHKAMPGIYRSAVTCGRAVALNKMRQCQWRDSAFDNEVHKGTKDMKLSVS